MLAAGLGWAVSRRVLRPLTAVTTAAQAASQENLDRRLALAGPPDELKELADTFDAMLARLEAAFASQRRFVANASHELRTPLTEMRTLIDVSTARPAASAAKLEPVLAAIGAAVDRSEELIEALLTLARSDRGPGPAELVDLPTAVEDAINLIARPPRPGRSGSTPRCRTPRSAGTRVLLERLVSNLIDNAVKHNVTGGWVLASTRSDAGTAELTVANGGEHIPADQVTGLFEPFRRLGGRTGNRPAPASAFPSWHRSPMRMVATPRPTPGRAADWTCRSRCLPRQTGTGMQLQRRPGWPIDEESMLVAGVGARPPRDRRRASRRPRPSR